MDPVSVKDVQKCLVCELLQLTAEIADADPQFLGHRLHGQFFVILFTDHIHCLHHIDIFKTVLVPVNTPVLQLLLGLVLSKLHDLHVSLAVLNLPVDVRHDMFQLDLIHGL